MSEQPGQRLFSGATRAQHYREPVGQPEPAEETLVLDAEVFDQESDSSGASAVGVERVIVASEPSMEPAPRTTGSDLMVADAGVLARLEAPAHETVPVATMGWRAGVRKASGGLIKPKASEQELRHLEHLRVIRQATWPRAVNVMVANERGGAGRTTTALVLGGLLGSYRGGYVAVVEATPSRGTLLERAEGRPMRGLAELLASADEVHTAGAVGGFTAPQTSHADVIGSVAARPLLSGFDVHAIRAVLDRFYRITVTDTGSNPLAGPWLASVDTADALVVPVMPRRLSVYGAMHALESVDSRGDAGERLREHATAIITHDGGEEDKELAERLPDDLARLGFRHVVEVPYDAHIRAEGELTIGNMSPASINAWTEATARVIETLRDAPEMSPVKED